jgi:plastocyanin
MALARAAAACLAALAFAGCGSEAPVTLKGPVIRLRLDDYRIVPQDIRVPTGRLTVEIDNAGVLVHNLQVWSLDRSGGRSKLVGGTASLHPGERARVILDLAPGTYAMLCSLGNHADLGQTGTLTVTTGRS